MNANQDVENPALRLHSTGKIEGKVEVELEVRVVIAFQEDRVTPILDIAVVMEYVLTATAAVPEIRASLLPLVSTAALAADAALIRDMKNPALHVHSAREIEVEVLVALQKINIVVKHSLDVPDIVMKNVLTATTVISEMRDCLLFMVPTAA